MSVLDEFYQNAAKVASQADVAPDNTRQQSVDPSSIVTAPSNIGETFSRSVKAGAIGLDSDLDYFAALANTAMGDKEAAKSNIAEAQQSQAQSGQLLAATGTFEEFLGEPTVGGFFEQVAKGTGQLVPFVVSSIGSAGIGAVGAVAAKAGVRTAGKKLAEKIVKESVEKAQKGLATEAEQAVAQGAFEIAKRGAIGGAAFGEYVPIAGSNFSEAVESGKDLDPVQAFRAAALAAPQAVIGVGGEVAFAKMLGRVAKDRSKGDSKSFYGQVANSFLKGSGEQAVVQTGTELLQEGISVANRMDLDETFTSEDAKLRLAETAFASFFGGGALGGAGAGGVRALKGAPREIFDRANQLVDAARDFKVGRAADQTAFGTDTTYSAPESQSTIDAQLDAMVDPSSSKNAVWIEGEAPYENATTGVKETTHKGQKAYAAFIPGRGTIISPDAEVVVSVVEGKADDSVLAAALGFSNTKPTDGDRVVQVLDAEDRVVSEELTNEAGEQKAVDAGRALMPEGGRLVTRSPDEVLRDRNDGLKESFSDPDEVSDPNEQVEVTEESEAKEAGLEEIEGELVDRQTYKPRATADTVFEGTEPLRTQFKNEFGGQYNVDFSDNFWGVMSDAMLRKAIDARRQGLEVEFNKTPDGDMQLEVFNFEESFTVKDGQGERRVPLDQFLEIELARAAKSEQARRSNVRIKTPDGKIRRTNLIDLLNAGRRINQTRDQASFDGDTAGALSTILGELALADYKIQIDTPFGPQNLLNFVDLLVKQSALNRKHYKDVITKGQPDAPYPRLPELDGIYDVVVGKDGRGNPLKLGKALLPRNVESAPTTPLQNDDDAVRKPTVDSMGNVIFEDEIGFDGTTEMERMEGNESEVPPVATPGIDGPAKYNPPKNLDRFSRGRRVSNGRDKTPRKPQRENPSRTTKQNVTYPLGPINEQVAYLIGRAVKKLPLKQTASIYGLSQLEGLTFEQLFGNHENPALARLAYDRIQEMLTNDSATIAFYFYDSGAAHQIIFDDRFLPEGSTPNSLAAALDISHELGHAFFEEERIALKDNPALLERLYNSFLKDLEQDTELADFYESAYPAEKIFEEWYADQFSRAAAGEFANPKNIKESYFKRLVDAIKKMYAEITRLTKLRAGQPVAEGFQQYLDNVLARRKTEINRAMKAEYEGSPAAIVRVNKIRESLAATPGVEGRADVWKRKLRSGLNQYKGIFSVILTADGQLRSISSRLADMFYIPAQSAGKAGMGFIRSYYTQYRSFKNEFEDSIGDLNDPEVQKAVEDAAIEGPLDPSNTKAQAVRDFLAKIHREYIEPSQAGYAPDLKIDFQENYFPTMLNLAAIADNPDAFISLLLEAQTAGDPEQIRKAVQRIVKYQQSVINGQEIEVEGLDPAEGRADARALTRGIDRQLLADKGFLKDPDVALTTYLRQIAKRVEWNKATKDESGTSKLLPMLNMLDSKDRALAEKIISIYLGHQTKEVAPWLRKVNSYGQLLQFITILPFSTIASIPELAGPILNFKEFGGFQAAFQELRSQFIGDREATKRFARDIGVVANESMANAWVSEADLDYMDPIAREWSDKFFKVIGLDLFTRFSREFAAGMAQRFLHEHAYFPKERSERYLADLGVTAEEVKKYFDNELDITSPEAIKVKQAAQQFVESSILRPNAAERPLWGSDPRFALIWQLKGYFYAFYKVIIKGTMSEAKARRDEGGSLPAVAGVFALAAVGFMPLAMAAMETREWAKYGLSELLPFSPEGKDYFRSDRMDWGEYMFEVFDRSGFLGPWSLGAMMHQNAEWNRSPLIPLLGPTAETIDTVFRDGWRSIPNRLIPIHNQL
ncbi:MAG: hypothetical protein CMJ25_21405 [Phycisphaerae bacterium]|nr:hypothetical protein [Phycisphaerae bacterium]|tara:strand:+ start:38698 stop:44178 length:5481 start_codon:yes stop_codon:yes gene_type:complete